MESEKGAASAAPGFAPQDAAPIAAEPMSERQACCGDTKVCHDCNRVMKRLYPGRTRLGPWQQHPILVCTACSRRRQWVMSEHPEAQSAWDFGTIDDGFGNEWCLCRPDCGLEVVRPGSVQCSAEDCPQGPG